MVIPPPTAARLPPMTKFGAEDHAAQKTGKHSWTPEEDAKLTAAVTKAGLTFAALNQQKPSMVMLSMSMIELRQLGVEIIERAGLRRLRQITQHIMQVQLRVATGVNDELSTLIALMFAFIILGLLPLGLSLISKKCIKKRESRAIYIQCL